MASKAMLHQRRPWCVTFVEMRDSVASGTLLPFVKGATFCALLVKKAIHLVLQQCGKK